MIWDPDIISELYGFYATELTLLEEGVKQLKGGPVLYTAEELQKCCQYWGGKPILADVPFNGKTADDKEVLEKQKIGVVWKARWNNYKRTLDCLALFDTDFVKNKYPRILDKLGQDNCILGWCKGNHKFIEESGVWNGEKYIGRIVDIKPECPVFSLAKPSKLTLNKDIFVTMEDHIKL